jgi:DNA-binding transcriptional MocR family regulator
MERSALPLSQAPVRDGVVELSIGQPDLTLLPSAALAEAATSALRRYGSGALDYGAAAGPGPLVEWLRDHLERIDQRAPDVSELMVTGGNSHAIDLAATMFARGGDVALVEVPTYHLAIGILRDHDLEIVGVETDDDGLRLDALVDTVDRLHAADRRVALLYTVPTFGNPTGRTMPIERRREIAAFARRHNLVVVEDDVYRELAFEGVPPPSIGAVDPGAPVLRLGSFSKTLAPGLRLGWLTGPAPLVRRVVDGGLLTSGGGQNPLIGLAVAEFAAAGAYERNVEHLRRIYRARRDVLVAALRAAIPEARFDIPTGGYFVWLQLPGELDARKLLAAADARGVTYVPGALFDVSGSLDPSWLRLAFTRYAEDELALGARRLGELVHSLMP